MLSTNGFWRIALAASLGLILLAVYLGDGTLWGLEHFKYNPPYGWWLLGLLVLGSLHFAFGWLPSAYVNRTMEKISRLIWGKYFVVRIFIAACSTGLFYLFRVQTAFLGDGYFLLNTFGRDEAYSSYAIKPISIWIIKLVQSAFGGYSYWTALSAFQTISIVAGFFVVYNFIAIAGLIADSARGRLLAFGTMLFAAWSLLFFGYIEFYPMLWLAAAFFVRYAISYAKGLSSFWTVLLTFLLAVAIHLEALFFLPGILYLTAHRFARARIEKLSPRAWAGLTAAMILAVLAVVFAAGQLLPEMGNPFLPLFAADSTLQHYSVLSIENLREFGNQFFLCVPAVLVLLALAFSGGRREPDHTSRLLGLLSFGSLAYQLTIEPKLGLARDFDLMTLSLLAPLLWLLYRIVRSDAPPVRAVLAAVLISLIATGSFIGANCVVATSITRAHDLLEYYGTKDKQGWLSFAKFLQAEGQTPLGTEVNARINALFPEQGRYQTALSLISRGKLAEAEHLVQSLIAAQPENGEFLAALAEIRVGQQRYAEAVNLYQQALRTHPNHRVYAGLGRAYLSMNDFDRAIEALEKARELSSDNEGVLSELCRVYRLAGRTDDAGRTADKLLAVNRRSPEGNLTKMVGLIEAGRTQEAAAYYREFVNSGSAHPEYETVKSQYAWLLGGVN
jgi:tetratricopeptide (TPR) repeat protein